MILQHTTVDDFIKKISSEDALFHYTRRNIFFEEILYKNFFLLSNFKNTDDPLEYKNRLINAVCWGPKNQSDKIVPKITNKIQFLIKEKTLFASFCINKFHNNNIESHGFLKPRMWAQYGERHKGLCLVFSKNKIIRSLNKVIENSSYLFFHDKVKYNEYVHDSASATLNVVANRFMQKTPHELAIDHISKYYKDLFFIKQNDFEREDEYRFIVLDTTKILSKKTIIKFDALETLIGIIAGDRFPDMYYPLIRNIIEEKHIECRKLIWDRGKYFLLSKNHFYG